MKFLDLKFVRSFFPALDKEWTYFDNAGGTQTAVQVANRIHDYLLNSNVQLGASYDISVQSGKRVIEAQQKWAEVINAQFPSEVVLGSSTTMLLQNLSRSLSDLLKPGDEIIVTNCDHEANIGPWVNLHEKGIVVKSWKVNPQSLQLSLKDLDKLMSKRTRLVAFTHVSNILGTINPVKQITQFVHEKGAMVCVDGVAFAPHRLVDVQDLGVDFYVFSLYKVYGPHYSLLYAKQKHLEKLPGINHFFVDEIPYKLQPGNVNYELSYGLLGIIDYFSELYNRFSDNEIHSLHHQVSFVFDLVASHEQSLSTRFLEFLNSKKNVTIVGDINADKTVRVPTIAFVVENRKSSEIPTLVDKHKIGIRWGDFYARRLIEDLGYAKQDGVIRVSMVHYNTLDEVDSLIEKLDTII